MLGRQNVCAHNRVRVKKMRVLGQDMILRMCDFDGRWRDFLELNEYRKLVGHEANLCIDG